MEVTTPCPDSDGERRRREQHKQIMEQIKVAVQGTIPWVEGLAMDFEYAVRRMQSYNDLK